MTKLTLKDLEAAGLAFTEENFSSVVHFTEEDSEERIASLANVLLLSRLEKMTEVFGSALKNSEIWDWATDRCIGGTDTHSGRLVCVKELKGEG